MRSEHAREELGRHLVVLLVGLVGEEGNRRAGERGDEGLLDLGRGLRVAVADLDQPLLEKPADAHTDHPVGHEALLDPADCHGAAA